MINLNPMNYFSLLICLLTATIICQAQEKANEAIPYGYNSDAGAYFDVGRNTKLYYEIYGKGEPLLMLHGGVYGYIEEFSQLIPRLAKKYRVICLATRGHVKSDIGHEPFTYEQRASDAIKLIRHLNLTKVTVIGFSDGGYSAYKLAALYPDAVTRMVVMGAGDHPAGRDFGYSAEGLRKSTGSFFDHKIANMPEPERWDESLHMLNALYKNSVVSTETFSRIKCPVLIMSGEKDEYTDPTSVQRAHTSLANSQVVIIPGCGHVIFDCNLDATWSAISGFLN
jgi:pimeloyl-ACP methyl ester carboxylesterase